MEKKEKKEKKNWFFEKNDSRQCENNTYREYKTNTQS